MPWTYVHESPNAKTFSVTFQLNTTFPRDAGILSARYAMPMMSMGSKFTYENLSSRFFGFGRASGDVSSSLNV